MSSSILHMYLLIGAKKKKKNMKINQKFIRLCKTVGEKKKVGEKRMERKGVEIEVERIGK